MNLPEDKNKNKNEVCPHCGKPLSPWQMVLLEVDRAIMCKNCWYRIILDPREENKPGSGKENNDDKKN